MSPEPVVVSVIIPAWNVQDYIARALKSVLSQTRPPDEIIVVDDGSTDQTAAIVQAFGPGIRYVHQNNRGLSGARNTGIQLATGNWVAFLDADDAWLPEKLACQIRLLESMPDLRWCATGYAASQPGNLSRETGPGNRVRSFFELDESGILILPSTVLIERACLLSLGDFREGRYFGEDIDLWLRLALAGVQLGYCGQPLVRYEYQRPGSLNDRIRDLERINGLLVLFDRAWNQAAGGEFVAELSRYIRRRIHDYIDTLIRAGRRDEAKRIFKRYRHLFHGRQGLEYSLRTAVPGMNRVFNWYQCGKKYLSF